MSDPRDPGWEPSRRLVASFFLARDVPRLPIVTLRAIYLAFVAALGVFVLIRLLIGDSDGDMQPGTAWAVLVIIAGLETALVAMHRTRPLIGDEPEEFAAAYRTSVILRLAYAESIALTGFVLSFLTGEPVSFYGAIALSLPAYLLAAPTAGDIARHQERVAETGVGVDLMAALLGYTAPD
ncbi:MAG TPA: hypothetical protein VK960_05010 [Acidimicrobiia bacterium]|nr:hypothetical protein [Acidimicrobiia bacterium]